MLTKKLLRYWKGHDVSDSRLIINKLRVKAYLQGITAKT
jgi:hypothetical protein